jgi:uncharacterized protein GlcG (DUF336 family)
MSRTTLRLAPLTLAALCAPLPASAADVVATSSQTLGGAERAARAAVAYARAHDAPGAAIAVVDAGGQTILVQRLDGTFAAGADISVGKARTAVMFHRPTRGLEETINKGRAAMIPVAAVTAFTPLQGGIPISVDGRIVGGMGVSGAAGAQAVEQAPPTTVVQRIAASKVTATFSQGATGGTLIEQPAFLVNASRRDGAGEAEVHRLDTDIFYVLQGTATLITGGELVEPRAQSATKQRGTAVRGGNALHLTPGDVVTIPSGVPHWFQSVQAPFRYLAIKSTAGALR